MVFGEVHVTDPKQHALSDANLERLGGLFFLTPLGIQFRGSFPDYLNGAQLDAKESPDKYNGLRAGRLEHIMHDLWNLTTLMRHSEWIRRLSEENTLWAPDWMAYAALDVENFYVQTRSLMDHVAEWLQVAAHKREVTSNSFEGLLASVNERATRAALGADVADLVAAASTWFKPLKEIRDRSVHYGAWTMVVPTPEKGIRFQVYASYPFNKPLVAFERPDDEFQDFRLVSSATVGEIVLLLNDLAAAVQNVRPVTHVEGGYIAAPGFSDLLEWCGTVPVPDPDAPTRLTVLLGQGAERRSLGEIDGTSVTYTRARIHLTLRAGHQLIGLLGNGYGARTFDLVLGKQMFVNCQFREMGTSIRMTGGGKGFVGGRCVLDYEDERAAPESTPT
jgi:hypothetical protein